MSAMEAPAELSEPKCGRRVLELNIRLLYWQGLWYEDPEPDLEFYLQYFSPRLANLLVRHRSLRLALRFFRTFYPCSLMIIFLYYLLVVCPFTIYVNWNDNRESSFNGFYFICINLFNFVTCYLFFSRKKDFYDIFHQLEKVFLPENLNNEDQTKLYTKAQAFCYKLTYSAQVYFVPMLSFMICIFSVFILLPNRQPLFIDLYPIETQCSPFYEIILFVRTFHFIATTFTLNSLAMFGLASFVHILAYFSVLINKMETIRGYSMAMIRRMKLSGSQQVAKLSSIIGQQIVSTRREEDVFGDIVEGSGSYYDASTDTDEYPLGYIPHTSVLVEDGAGFGQVSAEVERVDNLSLWTPQDGFNHRVIMVRSVNTYFSEEQEPAINVGKEEGDVRQRGEGLQQGNSNFTEENGITAEELEKEMLLQLGKFVNLHQQILSLTQNFGCLLNVIFTTHWIISVVVMGITTLILKNAVEITLLEMVQLIFTMELMFVYFLFNYEANMLTYQAAAVGDAVYACDWLEASPSFKRSLMIIMTRINIPLVFKPTGLKPLSLKNFAEVSNMAYKMLATLESIAK